MAFRIPPKIWVTFPEAVRLVSPPLDEVSVREAICEALRNQELTARHAGENSPKDWLTFAHAGARVWKTGFFGGIDAYDHLFEPIRPELMRAEILSYFADGAGTEQLQPSTKRGPRPAKFERVLAEMLAWVKAGNRLSMTEEAMVAQFKASRDTCRRARKKVRAILDNETSTNSDKTPTIDK